MSNSTLHAAVVAAPDPVPALGDVPTPGVAAPAVLDGAAPNPPKGAGRHPHDDGGHGVPPRQAPVLTTGGRVAGVLVGIACLVVGLFFIVGYAAMTLAQVAGRAIRRWTRRGRR